MISKNSENTDSTSNFNERIQRIISFSVILQPEPHARRKMRSRSRPFPHLPFTVGLGVLAGVTLLFWWLGGFLCPDFEGAPSSSTFSYYPSSYFDPGVKKDLILSNTGTQITLLDPRGVVHRYDSASPFIFIGGFPRSGTTLMRAILDVHSDVRCGQETHVIPKIVDYIPRLNSTPYHPTEDSSRLGLTDKMMDAATTAFVLQVLVRHGESATRLCDKDPLVLHSAKYVHHLFPNSKFVFMIRDGRASIHSVIERRVKVKDFNASDPRQCLGLWSDYMSKMLEQCEAVGPESCLKVHYESLVLQPRREVGRVLGFLGLRWEESVMHHEDFVDRQGEHGITLSKYEYSTAQVVEPIQTKALQKWADAGATNFYEPDVLRDMHELAPMLHKLGYPPDETPPDYAAIFGSP